MEKSKFIIHNCSNLSDEAAIDAVRAVVGKGTRKNGQYPLSSYIDGYEIQATEQKGNRSTFFVIGGQ